MGTCVVRACDEEIRVSRGRQLSHSAGNRYFVVTYQAVPNCGMMEPRIRLIPDRGILPMPLVDHPVGNYRFLPGIAPYSCGVVSAPGYEIVHVLVRH